jgi:hypothetical protein
MDKAQRKWAIKCGGFSRIFCRGEKYLGWGFGTIVIFGAMILSGRFNNVDSGLLRIAMLSGSCHVLWKDKKYEGFRSKMGLFHRDQYEISEAILEICCSSVGSCGGHGLLGTVGSRAGSRMDCGNSSGDRKSRLFR